MVVTGLSVSSRILSTIGCPHSGYFLSTTTTPEAVIRTAVLPPVSWFRSTKRLSLSFSISSASPTVVQVFTIEPTFVERTR
jgi:hypothetical protein